MFGSGFLPFLPPLAEPISTSYGRPFKQKSPSLTVIHGKSIRLHILGLAHSLAEPQWSDELFEPAISYRQTERTCSDSTVTPEWHAGI